MSVPIYLIAGESFLSDEALDQIRAQEGTDPLSEIAFDPDVEPASLLAALGTSSLLGGRRLVVIHGAQDLRKEQVEAIDRYLESPSPDSVLVAVAAGKSKLEPSAKRAGTVVALESPKGRKLAGWLRQRATDHGLKLDERAAYAMIDSVGNELRDLDGALSQLATAHGSGAKLGARDIKEMFSRLADERVYAFTDAVGDRRLPQAMTALRRLLDQGEEPLMVFGALTGQVRRMLRARRYTDQGPKAVADAMGLPGWRAERLHRQARAYREDELVEAMSILSATDVEMKGGDLPPDIALEVAVTKIVTGAKRAVEMF